MRFLLDVNISTRIAKMLNEGGHDVVRAALRCPTASDSELLHLAVAENRIMVTEDSDFSDLIFVDGAIAPRSLFFIRCPPSKQSEMAPRVVEALETDQIDGHIVVLTPTNTRFREFPKAAETNV